MHDEIVKPPTTTPSMWITEVGASSDEGNNPLERGPEGQADQLREAFDFFLAKRQEWDIKARHLVLVAGHATDQSQCDWCAGSGLFPADSLDPKPAWDAFVSFTGGSWPRGRVPVRRCGSLGASASSTRSTPGGTGTGRRDGPRT